MRMTRHALIVGVTGIGHLANMNRVTAEAPRLEHEHDPPPRYRQVRAAAVTPTRYPPKTQAGTILRPEETAGVPRGTKDEVSSLWPSPCARGCQPGPARWGSRRSDRTKWFRKIDVAEGARRITRTQHWQDRRSRRASAFVVGSRRCAAWDRHGASGATLDLKPQRRRKHLSR